MRDLERYELHPVREAAAVVLSSDCDEVFGASDRFLALYEDRSIPLPAAPSGHSC